ncbi:MAG: sigma-70 family RNA polymerase sigma factor [Deltaproteobacteria bacterium]|nr:sigma-70 family RNA polymerase sigma factor [Deltaproteobacteria bacterium]
MPPPDEPRSTDEQLLQGWQAGDALAGKVLFRRHYGTVARFFHNKVPTLSARKDLIQEVFLACVKNAASFHGRSTFKTYLLAIATNLWRNYHRDRRGPRNHEPLSDASIEGGDPTPSSVIARREEERILLAALRGMTFELQLLLELKYWEKLKLHELATTLGWSDAKVKNKLRKGKRELEKNLAALASSPERLASTLTGLDDWAHRVREQLSGSSSAAGGP